MAQNYEHEYFTSIATKAPTLQRIRQRLILFVEFPFEHESIRTRDVTQTKIQYKTSLEMELLIGPPPEMELTSDKVLTVIKPL